MGTSNHSCLFTLANKQYCFKVLLFFRTSWEKNRSCAWWHATRPSVTTAVPLRTLDHKDLRDTSSAPVTLRHKVVKAYVPVVFQHRYPSHPQGSNAHITD